jgi:MFS superfamily sulfate permease-like transporter
MKPASNGYKTADLSHDFGASIVLFLVALPLCMGIAIASGLPPAAGLITGIVGGIVAGSLSGCSLQASGPAAGLTVIIFDIIQEHGVEVLAPVIILAGAFQIIAGILRLGQWFRAVSPAVINGMLSGIGLLILLSQFHVMLDDKPKGDALQNLLSIPEAIYNCFPARGLDGSFARAQTDHIAGCLGLFTIAIVIFWQWLAPKKLKLIPGSLIAIVIATIACIAFDMPIKKVELPASLVEVIKIPTWESITLLKDSKLLFEALALAFIASTETLLTAAAIDRMQTISKTNYDRELGAQGIGNLLCGLLGALPMTGVIVRSGVNVQSGARSRLSTIFHGLWLLLFVVFLPGLLSQIPVAALAALLVYTGYKLLNFKVVKSLAKYGKSEVAIYFATLITIIVYDLLTGVILGVILSVVKLLYMFSHLDIRIEQKEKVVALYLKGAATFLSLPKLAQALESIPSDVELRIDLKELNYVDHACLDLIMNVANSRRESQNLLVIDWGILCAKFKERQLKPEDLQAMQQH